MYRKLALAVVLAQLIACATVWAADVQTGNWKLNIANPVDNVLFYEK